VFDIPAVDDPRILVPIPVPVKGRKTPLVLRLPRFDFIDEDQHDAMNSAAAEVVQANADAVPRKQQWLVHLAWLKPHVPPKGLRGVRDADGGSVECGGRGLG
jgi:hypothetical protein